MAQSHRVIRRAVRAIDASGHSGPAFWRAYGRMVGALCEAKPALWRPSAADVDAAAGECGAEAADAYRDGLKRGAEEMAAALASDQRGADGHPDAVVPVSIPWAVYQRMPRPRSRAAREAIVAAHGTGGRHV